MKSVLIGLIMIAIVVLSGCNVISGNTINVAGNSELTFDADEAEVWAGITILKDSADEAQSEANKVIKDVIAGLVYHGFDKNDLSTEQLNLREEKDWREGESKGWRATQTLKVKTTDLDRVGVIVDIFVNNGANQIQNINFGLTEAKEQEYKIQALADATKNAREKAETIADGLGVELGKLKTVSESNYFARPYMYAMETSIGKLAVTEAAQVLPGDVTITGNVQLVYNIK